MCGLIMIVFNANNYNYRTMGQLHEAGQPLTSASVDGAIPDDYGGAGRRSVAGISRKAIQPQIHGAGGMIDASQISPEKRVEHWKKTSRLMWTLMFWWFVFSFGVHLFAVQLNGITVFGFPLGFYMAAQGSLIAFVVLCVWNAIAQNRLDEEYGVAED
ncbi:MAG: DUF4212 domain-containing protein [Rhodospirillales bacterium]|jgi:putative solute:sodium symporter small subunit|nr:DUF4212 domain-containing protein [Rhodospirillales bacterium]